MNQCLVYFYISFDLSLRVFGSGFLSHQGSLTEVAMEQGNIDNSVVEVASGELLGDIREVDRVEVFQRINVTMDMKTNVPEPFNADISDEMLKEGVPVGLSDSQVRECFFQNISL